MANGLGAGPVLVVQVGDLHIGSTIGLWPRRFVLDDGNETRLNRLQELALEHWHDAWRRRRAQGLPIVTVLMADTIDGNHHATTQLMTGDEEQMVSAAVDLLTPVAGWSAAVLAVRGTPAHVGVAGKWDNTIAQRIGARRVQGRWSQYHLRAEVGGVLYNVAHHGPTVGKRIHLGVNALHAYARNVMLLQLARGQRVPDVIVRGHVHRKAHEVVTERASGKTTHMIVTPAFQWATEFKYRIDTEDDLADVGMAWQIVERGRVVDSGFDCISIEQSALVRL